MAFLLTILAATPLAAQRRVEIIVDAEGVRRQGHAQFEPNTVTYDPQFDDGGGAGFAIVWFFSGRMALETKVAGLASKLTVRRTGDDFFAAGELGYAQIYPISAVLQWHPFEEGGVRPYVGAGVAHIILRNIDEAAAGVAGIEFDDPTGLVVNAGLRVPLSKRWSLNGDARYVALETQGRARFPGTPFQTEIEVRPLIVAVGIAYSF